MLLVIILIVVIAGITIPQFSNTYQSILHRKTVDEMVYVMRYGQSLAVTLGQDIQMHIDDGRQSYQLMQVVEGDEPDSREQTWIPIEGRYGKERSLAEGHYFETEQVEINFHPNGVIDPAYIKICKEEKCYLISTQERRGHVDILEQVKEG
ncbi:MAG: hypothetical protein KC713_01670 [Candidatus Omnitrophica bacterium]|nr:hypothetical protein [Candidatus Omnitrophota bacterium]